MQSKLPMHLSPRCRARTRAGTLCRSPAMTNGRCRMHGGASKWSRMKIDPGARPERTRLAPNTCLGRKVFPSRGPGHRPAS
jgi:hypothetical protein